MWKNFCIAVVISLCSVFIFQGVVVKEYKEKSNEINKNNVVYRIKIGEYSNYDEMTSTLKNVNNYMYDSDKFNAYVCVTTNLEFANKVKGNYQNKANNIVVEKIEVDFATESFFPPIDEGVDIEKYCKDALSVYEGVVRL